MSGWSRFQSQFTETDWERRQRFAKRKREHTERGECWQCGKAFADCDCPNLQHSRATVTTLSLPRPPSINRLYRAVQGRSILSEAYRSWKAEAGALLMSQRVRKVPGQVEVLVECALPDKRRRDIDNVGFKAVLDAIHRVRPDLRLHGFGVKTTALMNAVVRRLLATADSMGWSFAARKQGRNSNDWREAMRFAETISQSVLRPAQPFQASFYPLWEAA